MYYFEEMWIIFNWLFMRSTLDSYEPKTKPFTQYRWRHMPTDRQDAPSFPTLHGKRKKATKYPQSQFDLTLPSKIIEWSMWPHTECLSYRPLRSRRPHETNPAHPHMCPFNICTIISASWYEVIMAACFAPGGNDWTPHSILTTAIKVRGILSVSVVKEHDECSELCSCRYSKHWPSGHNQAPHCTIHHMHSLFRKVCFFRCP